MLDLFGIYHAGSYSLPVKQIKKQKAVIAGGFHHTMMFCYGKRADELPDTFYGIGVSSGLITRYCRKSSHEAVLADIDSNVSHNVFNLVEYIL